MNHILTENNDEPTISVNQLNALIDLITSAQPSKKSQYAYYNDVIVCCAVNYINQQLRNDGRTYKTPNCDKNINLERDEITMIIRKLRNETGFGIMNCKKALEECDFDYEKAKVTVKELESQISYLCDNLPKEMVDLPSECNKIIDEHFMELL